MPRDSKVTPITRNEPRTFYATRVARTISGEVWDLWTVADGRRIGALSVIDDGEIVYGLAAVKKGTDHEELTDLMDGLYPPQSTESTRQELMVVEYEEEPKVYDTGV
jgi:hypothetical protein